MIISNDEEPLDPSIEAALKALTDKLDEIMDQFENFTDEENFGEDFDQKGFDCDPS
jgi:hypothetical protein